MFKEDKKMTNKFKINDIVRITRRIGDYTIGTKGTIKEYFKEYSLVAINGSMYSISNNFLDIVKEGEKVVIKEKIELKIGSKVRKVRVYDESNYSRYGYEAGRIPMNSIGNVINILDRNDNGINDDEYDGIPSMIYMVVEGVNVDSVCLDITELDIIIPITEKELKKKKDKIIKEINGNKEFKGCFENVKEEVYSWDENKLNNWEKQK